MRFLDLYFYNKDTGDLACCTCCCTGSCPRLGCWRAPATLPRCRYSACRAAAQAQLDFWLTPVGGDFFFCGKRKIGQNCQMRTEMRLSSRFCLFCGAKQAKTSPVRRLSTLNSDFCFRAADFDYFQWCSRINFWLLEFSKRGISALPPPPASKIRARPRAAQYPAYRRPVFGRHLNGVTGALLSGFRFCGLNSGCPTHFFLAFCRQARQPAPA